MGNFLTSGEVLCSAEGLELHGVKSSVCQSQLPWWPWRNRSLSSHKQRRPLRSTTLIQTIFFLPPHANKSKPEYFSTLRVEYIGNERWQWAVPWSWCCSSTGSFRGIMLRYICEMYYAIQRIVWQRSSEIHFATLVRVSLFWERGCWNTVRVHKGEKWFFLLLLRIFCDIVRLVTSLKKWSNHQC